MDYAGRKTRVKELAPCLSVLRRCQSLATRSLAQLVARGVYHNYLMSYTRLTRPEKGATTDSIPFKLFTSGVKRRAHGPH